MLSDFGQEFFKYTIVMLLEAPQLRKSRNKKPCITKKLRLTFNVSKMLVRLLDWIARMRKSPQDSLELTIGFHKY
jgi:hypothetical protein